MMPLGLAHDGLAVGDARRARLDVDMELLGQPAQDDLEVQLAESAHHGFIGAGVVLDVEAGVLGLELVQGIGQLLLVAAFGGVDRQPVERDGALHGGKVEVVLVVRVVQHGVEMDVVHPRHRQDVARYALGNLDQLVAVQPEQVVGLEGLARVPDEELARRRNPALMDAEDADLAAVGVVDDLEDVGDGVQRWVRTHLDWGHVRALALEEGRRVALAGVRHEARQDLQELRDTGTGLRRDEADGDQMGLAQGGFERVMQLLGLELLALLQIDLHQRLVDLDHLVDDVAVRLFDR